MSNESTVPPPIIPNANAYVNVFLERSSRANEGHTGANESSTIIMKETWTRMFIFRK